MYIRVFHAAATSINFCVRLPSKSCLINPYISYSSGSGSNEYYDMYFPVEYFMLTWWISPMGRDLGRRNSFSINKWVLGRIG